MSENEQELKIHKYFFAAKTEDTQEFIGILYYQVIFPQQTLTSRLKILSTMALHCQEPVHTTQLHYYSLTTTNVSSAYMLCFFQNAAPNIKFQRTDNQQVINDHHY